MTRGRAEESLAMSENIERGERPSEAEHRMQVGERDLRVWKVAWVVEILAG